MGEEARGSDDDGGGRSEVTAEYADRRHGSEERWTARRTRPRIVAEEFKHSAVILANDTNNFVVAALAAMPPPRNKRRGSVRRALFADSTNPGQPGRSVLDPAVGTKPTGTTTTLPPHSF